MSEPVTKTDMSAQPDIEAEGDLDSLLNEFSEATKPAVQTKPETEPNVKELASYIEEQRRKEYQKEFKSDLDTSIKSIKDGLELEIDLPDSIVKGYLFAKADEDPRFNKAWENRKTDPAAFNKVLKALQKDIQKQFQGSPDKQATNDREAVVSAVRSATKKAPTSDDFPDKAQLDKMSDGEFQKLFSSLR